MKLAEQVELIRQVFGYVDQFKDKVFVIRIDGEIIMDPLFPVLVRLEDQDYLIFSKVMSKLHLMVEVC